jgi:uncharacterized membrane protein YkgB
MYESFPKSSKGSFISIFKIILSLIFVYTGSIKFANYQTWMRNFSNIEFVSNNGLTFIGYAFPFLEIIVALLLLYSRRSGIVGAWVSFFMYIVFNVYLANKIYVDDISHCICGGIFSQISDVNHILLNVVLGLASLYIARSPWEPK